VKKKTAKQMILSAPSTSYDLLMPEEKARVWDVGGSICTSHEDTIADNAREREVEPNWDAISEAISLMERNTVRLLRELGFGVTDYGHDRYGDLTVGITFTFEDRKTAEQAAEFGWLTDGQERFPVSEYFVDAVYENVPDEIAGLVDVDLIFNEHDPEMQEFIEWLEEHKLDRYEYWKQ
jgi:hypothetical protein